ncbi:hypothetical protein AB0O63_03125 [Streptomyces cyaneofuscatus]|uniref:hypothetical protein n=1 Tax=Streptomyces cyaneofuscatus TaxID=66883 RepID=UPI00343978AE
MAFSADELRVLRRALAIALHPMPLSDEDVQDCLRLAGSVDEAVGEAGRLRAFLLADLARYRAALPGSVTGYLELLQDALAAGYDPRPDDLAALRALRGKPLAAALLERCQILAELLRLLRRKAESEWGVTHGFPRLVGPPARTGGDCPTSPSSVDTTPASGLSAPPTPGLRQDGRHLVRTRHSGTY